jgi:hypothetical protein
LLRAPFVLAIANNFPVAKNGDISTFRFFDAVFWQHRENNFALEQELGLPERQMPTSDEARRIPTQVAAHHGPLPEGYLAETRCSWTLPADWPARRSNDLLMLSLSREGWPSLNLAVSRALCELIAYWFVMRSVDHHEARSVGQSRAAWASQIVRNATSRSKGRRGTMPTGSGSTWPRPKWNKLRAAFKCNRHGHRDWLIKLVTYRHGLRISQTCDLRWDDIDLPKRTNWCGSVPNTRTNQPARLAGRGRRRFHNPGLNVDDKK